MPLNPQAPVPERFFLPILTNKGFMKLFIGPVSIFSRRGRRPLFLALIQNLGFGPNLLILDTCHKVPFLSIPQENGPCQFTEKFNGEPVIRLPIIF